MSKSKEPQKDVDAASRPMRCSTAPVSTNENIDGLYRYRWTTRFGRHTVFYEVSGGIIQENIASQMSPIKGFEGRTISDFAQARLMKDWRFEDDSLYQITIETV